MNIIVSSLNDIKKTGICTDLDSAKLFLSKKISNTDLENLLLNIRLQNNGTYFLIASPSSALEKNDYLGYRLYSKTNIPNGSYSFKIGNLSIENFEVESNEKLIDQHDPIYIIDRKINPVTTTIVAEDANSQQLTFYINKKYDGVSFIDDGSKSIYADYIPLDLKKQKEEGKISEEINFFSSKLNIIHENVEPPVGRVGEWIILKWDLPYEATKLAGIIHFAISVIDKTGDTRTYTWQTLPSSFVVSQNLAKRGDIVLSPEETSRLTELVAQVNTLQTDVNNLEAFLGNQTDDESDNDTEVIIGGGGALREEDKL